MLFKVFAVLGCVSFVMQVTGGIAFLLSNRKTAFERFYVDD